MALEKFEKDIAIISKLDDEPNDVGGLTAAELKAKFDEGGEALKAYINDVLIPALKSTTGAGEIGATLLGQPCTAQEAIDSVQRQIGEVVLGQIPDGTITPAKLSWEQELPFVLWLYVLGLPMTEEQVEAVEGNPSLMEIFSNSRLTPATKEEAEAGTDNSKMMTPRRTKESIAANAIRIGQIISAYYDLEAESNGRFLTCDGREIQKSVYPELVEKIQAFAGVKEKNLAISPSGTANRATAGAVSDNGEIFCMVTSNGNTGTVFGGGYSYQFSIPNAVNSGLQVGYQNGFFYVLNPKAGSAVNPGYLYKVDYVNKTIVSILTIAATNDYAGAGLTFKKNGILYFIFSKNGASNALSVNSAGATSQATISAEMLGSPFVLGDYVYFVKTDQKWYRCLIGGWAAELYPLPKLTTGGSNVWYTCFSIAHDLTWAYLTYAEYNHSQGKWAYLIDLDGDTPRVTRLSLSNPNSYYYAARSFVTKVLDKLLWYAWGSTNSGNARFLNHVTPTGGDLILPNSRQMLTVPSDYIQVPISGSSSVFIGDVSPSRAQTWDFDMTYVPAAPGVVLPGTGNPEKVIAYIKAKEG